MHALLIALALGPPAAAQTSGAEAIALAQAYHDTHNSHDLAATMAFYAPDASFQLNMGRPLVEGRIAITELERFDAIAGSSIYPFGWRAQRQGDSWIIRVDGVVESSRIFSALGLPIVIAVPDAPVMSLKDGKIIRINQPAFRPACRTQIFAGFTALAGWLQSSDRPLANSLLVDGHLALKPELLPAVIEQIVQWRGATGWSPNPSQARACAEPAFSR